MKVLWIKCRQRHDEINFGQQVIRPITTLAAALRTETLAAGLQDLTQFEVLKRERCQNLHVCLFSRPVAANALARLLRDGAGSQR